MFKLFFYEDNKYLHFLETDTSTLYDSLIKFLDIEATWKDIKKHTFVAVVKAKNYPKS